MQCLLLNGNDEYLEQKGYRVLILIIRSTCAIRNQEDRLLCLKHTFQLEYELLLVFYLIY